MKTEISLMKKSLQKDSINLSILLIKDHKFTIKKSMPQWMPLKEQEFLMKKKKLIEN